MKQITDFISYKEDGFYWVKPAQKKSRVKLGLRVGFTNREGYRVFKFNGKQFKDHRLAWEFHNGDIPAGMEIDNINHIRDDNRIDNLRLVIRSENMKNTSMRNDNKSGFTGVSWCKENGKWKSQIQVNGIKISLGYYNDINDAVTARNNANIKHKFHRNHGK